MQKIDVHGHVGEWFFAARNRAVFQDGAQIESVLEQFGIALFLASSSKAIVYDLQEGNADLAALLGATQRLRGYVVVNPHYPEASLADLDQYLPKEKFVGVKYHPSYARVPVSDKRMEPLLTRIQAAGVPLKVHTFGDGESSPLHLLSVHQRFPQIPLIAAHMGGPRLDLALELAQQTEANVFLEICTSLASAGRVEQAVQAAGVERVLFGTDYTLFSPAHSIGAVEAADLSLAERQRIFCDNAAELFGF